jgi:hypothetical protein
MAEELSERCPMDSDLRCLLIAWCPPVHPPSSVINRRSTRFHHIVVVVQCDGDVIVFWRVEGVRTAGTSQCRSGTGGHDIDVHAICIAFHAGEEAIT